LAKQTISSLISLGLLGVLPAINFHD